MSRQGKTRRRLFYLLGGTLVLGGLAGGAALYRMHYINQRALQGRTDGLASMARKDYPAALTQLGLYLARYPTDVDVLLPYAMARQNVEEANGHHLAQAISLYQRVLELKPDQPDAQRNLVDLYYKVGYNTEAVKHADTLLAASPSDTHVLYIKASALRQMQHLDQAQIAVQQLTSLVPLNLDFQILAIDIMLRNGKQDQVEPYADALARAHPGDVRFELLKSIAAKLTGKVDVAVNLVQPLVARPQPDAAYTQLLIRQLDELELFGQAFAVIQRVASGNPDHEMTQLWISRLFESNRLPMLLDETKNLDPAAPNSDAQIVAMRVLAFVRLGRRPEGMQTLDALEKRSATEPSAARWSVALRALTQDAAPEPISRIKILRDALTDNSSNPVLLEELADAYASAGSRDNAIATWEKACEAAPSWSAPFVRLSQTFLAVGNRDAALAMAQAAQRRAPDDRDALLSLAVAETAALPAGPSPLADKILAQITDLKQRFPNDCDVLTLQACVLAQMQQRDAAIQVIRTVLATNPAPSEKVLLTLAGLSASSKFDQEEACFEVCQKQHGLTAELAFARARWLLEHQRGPEGLSFLEKTVADHAGDLVWSNIWVAYLDLSGDQRAKDAWVALGDGNPKNVRVQWGALAAAAVQQDHDFMGRTIDRLVDLLGNDSVSLRLIRARWLLQGQSTENDLTRASIMLSDISRNSPDTYAPRLLLATCYMRLGNYSAAIDQLIAVSNMQPDQAGFALEVAQLLQARGDFSRAREFIDRAAHSKLATLQNMRQAASLLTLQGDYKNALALLEKAYAGAAQQPPDLVLAVLYRQLNQFPKAEEICRHLLEKPDVNIISFSADFYASQGRLDDARHALSLLDGLKLPAGTKELVLADFATRYESPDAALKQLHAAILAAPADANVWKQLVSYSIGVGKIDEALAAIDEASKKSIAVDFTVLRQNAPLLKQAAPLAGTRELLMMLNSPPATAVPILDALHIVVDAAEHKELPRQTALKLRQIADKNPRILPLQTITLHYYVAARQVEEAVNMANKVVESFPAAVEPLRIATGVLGAAQEWDQALGTAKEWRRLGTGENMDADLAIASAEIHLGDPNSASRQIQPYLERAAQDPDKFTGVILLRAQAFLAAHQPAQAEALLGPLLSKSAEWRNLWMFLAVRNLDDAARARAWLERVAPLVTDAAEKTVVAEAWMSIGAHWKDDQCSAKGRALLQEIVSAPNPPLEALINWGEVCETASDWTGAENAYRHAIQQTPDSAVAYNDLAFVLVQRGGNLDEAQRAVAKALELLPNRPAFLDTKAAVQAAQKDFTGAVASLREARRQEPKNLEWQINLFAVLVESNQIPEAKNEAQQINVAMATSPKISPELQQRYDSARAKLQLQ